MEKDRSNIAIPGNIWKAEHFLATVWNIVTYLDKQLNSKEVKVQTPLQFLYDLNFEHHIDGWTLESTHDRMTSLLNTLEIVDVDKYSPLSCVVDFCALVSKYFKGFSII